MKRGRDLVETLTNLTLGGLINWYLTMKLFGVSPSYAIGTTALFFGVSWARLYAVRRFFRNTEDR